MTTVIITGRNAGHRLAYRLWQLAGLCALGVVAIIVAAVLMAALGINPG